MDEVRLWGVVGRGGAVCFDSSEGEVGRWAQSGV